MAAGAGEESLAPFPSHRSKLLRVTAKTTAVIPVGRSGDFLLSYGEHICWEGKSIPSDTGPIKRRLYQTLEVMFAGYRLKFVIKKQSENREKKGEEVMFSSTPLCLSKCRPEEPLKGITPSTGGEPG